MRVGRGSALEALLGAADRTRLVPYIERMMVEHPYTKVYEVDDAPRPARRPSPDMHFHPSTDCTKCPRLLYFERSADHAAMLDDKVGPQLQLIFKTGTALHCMLQSVCEEMGRLPGYPEFIGNEVRLVEEAINMGGYADTVLRMPGSDVDTIVDWKTSNPQLMRTMRGPKKEHVMQLNCYMHMYGKPADARLVYIDKGDCTMKEYDVPVVDMAPTMVMWSSVRDALSKGDPSCLVPQCSSGSAKCKKCPAGSFCHRACGDVAI